MKKSGKLHNVAIVTTRLHGLIVQKEQEKSYSLTTRYAASGIVTSFEFDTRVMICEEVE